MIENTFRKRHTIEMLALVSGGITALATVIDNFVLHSVAATPDPLIGPLVYTVLGYWAAVLITPVCNLCLGRRMDAHFSGLTMQKETQKGAIVAGGITGLATIFTFVGASLVDPSIALPLSAVYLVYLVCYETVKKASSWRGLVAPVVLVMLGVAGTSTERWDMVSVSATALVLLVVLGQGTQAVAQIAYQRGVDTTNPVNFHFWRIAWSTVVATMCTVLVVVVTHRTTEFFTAVQAGLPGLALCLPLRMILLYLSEITRGRAYAAGGSASEVAVLTTSRVLLGVPLTLLVSWLAPQAFGPLSNDPRIWVLRIVGAMLVFVGMALLQKISMKHEGRAFPLALPLKRPLQTARR